MDADGTTKAGLYAAAVRNVLATRPKIGPGGPVHPDDVVALVRAAFADGWDAAQVDDAPQHDTQLDALVERAEPQRLGFVAEPGRLEDAADRIATAKAARTLVAALREGKPMGFRSTPPIGPTARDRRDVS